ncbi:right-handed parallel beta-helix repeat-containing protein [Methanosarcina sp. T3]|uniref:right-handed parallel beta-helix repeat-containing protein n=1 Tax=Methanosarcina sp. T3 TaxID=3439062 RepID=UPI003F85EF71
MKLKSVLITLLLFFSTNPVSADVITVGFKNADYTSIQDAVDNANDTDIIIVHSGIYSENLLINKPLTLKTADDNSFNVTVKVTNSSNHIFHISSSNTSIIGFNLIAENESKIRSGIYLDNAMYCQILDNSISNVEDGILLSSSRENEIEGNSLFLNSLHGINISDSNNNVISKNTVFNNRYGIIVESSNNNIISNNNASLNENYGIALFKTNDSIVKENTATGNKHGICLTSSFNNEIENNSAVNNMLTGSVVWDSETNRLENNNFGFNRDSGLTLLHANKNNRIVNNELSHNENGIYSRGDGALIRNNTINSNGKYGILLIYTKDNVIENNTLLNNEIGIKTEKLSENQIFSNTIDNRLTANKLMSALLVLVVIGAVFYLKKESLLLKSLKILLLVFILLILAIVAWYFPFESGLPENNVEINNINWTDNGAVTDNRAINDSYVRGNLSMDFVYLHKNSQSLNLGESPETDILPVDIHIGSMGSASTLGDYTLLHGEPLTLEYSKPYQYSHPLDLKKEKQHHVLVEIYTKRYYEYPNPVYGDSHQELIGVEVMDINLKGK